MKVQVTALSLLLTLLAAPVFAHGGQSHVMGTVSALATSHVVMKNGGGKAISIGLSKDTKYQKGDAPAVSADLKVGDRAVIDVTGKEGSFTAIEIRFSARAAASPDALEKRLEAE